MNKYDKKAIKRHFKTLDKAKDFMYAYKYIYEPIKNILKNTIENKNLKQRDDMKACEYVYFNILVELELCCIIHKIIIKFYRFEYFKAGIYLLIKKYFFKKD